VRCGVGVDEPRQPCGGRRSSAARSLPLNMRP
jgi:hypothetical protein